MDEIFEICDEISVLRDGSLVMTKPSKETDMNELIAAMVGRSLTTDFRLWTTHREKRFSPYRIYQQNMHRNCRTSLLISKRRNFRILWSGWCRSYGTSGDNLGIRTKAEGNIVYDGKVLNFSSPKDAMDHGFALITEERKANGLFLKGDITFNTTIANMKHYKSESHYHMTRWCVQRLKKSRSCIQNVWDRMI